MSSEVSYCGQMVRAHDPDRFLLSMFERAEVREALWALYAFNYEIAKTREVVSETQLGLIRLQWWRDAIAGVYKGEVLEHQGLEALARAIEAHDLPQDLFDTLIYAREFDLEDVRPGNVEGLLNYADFTSSPLLKLAVRIVGGGAESEPVQPVAVNYALAGILRSVVFHAQQRRCYLPEDLMTQFGQRLDRLYELKPSKELSVIIEQIMGHTVAGVAPQCGLLKRYDKLAQMYLKQIKGVKYDVFSPKLLLEPSFKALRLWL